MIPANKRFLMILVCCLLITASSGCAISTMARQGVEQSTDEFAKWVTLFKIRLDTMPDADIAPFTIWVIQIIGDDKARLPREGERLVDKIIQFVTSKPDDYKFSKRERAELMGAWDRIFIILYEEAGKRSIGLMKKLMTASVI